MLQIVQTFQIIQIKTIRKTKRTIETGNNIITKNMVTTRNHTLGQHRGHLIILKFSYFIKRSQPQGYLS